MERVNSNNSTSRNYSSYKHQTNGIVRLRDLLLLCLSHWKWFAISLIITMGYAVFYLLKTPKVYTSSSSILIKSEGSGADNSTERQLQELGINSTSSNMTNEILSLKTFSVASEIVKRLNLDINYYHDGLFHKEVVYGLDLPVKVDIEGLDDNETVSFRLNLSADGTVTIKDMIRNGVSIDCYKSMRLGQTLNVKGCKITVEPTSNYKTGMVDNLEVVRSDIRSVATSVNSRISADLRDKNSTIIDVKYKDVSTSRAEDVLNTLIAVYNENWVKERNRIIVSTNDFIKERLSVIEQELGNVDEDISSYKSEHLIPDMQQVSSVAVTQAAEAEQLARDLDNQLYMTRYVRNYVTDGKHDNQLLPVNSGINNTGIEQQIIEYNETLLKRNKHLVNSSAQNPLVVDLNNNLNVMRHSIINSLENEMTMLNIQYQAVRSTHNDAVAKMAANPKQAEYLLTVERQQKVKETLYLFLLQKREENELSQAFIAYNTQLIDSPHGGASPAEPNSRNILVMALVLGLVIPGAILFIKENLNTTVRGRKDLERMKVPFIGEIPQFKISKREQKKHKNEPPQILVVEKSRNLINEAFRVVRTNLEFVLGFDSSHKVIMLTSINPGSGKTFITANLSVSFGIKNKRILAVDLDLRKGSLSKYLGEHLHGVSNYLSGQYDDYHDLIVEYNNIDILPCGSIPPNPTELLFSPNFKDMISELSREYDYVFIDCPPVEIVADSSIINRYVDLTLFIVRAQVLDRSYLSNIEQWYEEKKFTNMSVVLNGTSPAFNKRGYNKYGYYKDYIDNDDLDKTVPRNKKRLYYFIAFLCVVLSIICVIIVYPLLSSSSDVENSEKKDVPVGTKSENVKTLAPITSSDSKSVDSTQSVSKKSVSKETPKKQQRTYIIKAGESLTSISRQIYGTKDSVSSIIRKNNIEDPNNIQEGMELLLP